MPLKKTKSHPLGSGSGWLQRLTPGLVNSQYPYIDTIERFVHPGISWLDLGCGHQLLLDWMVNARQREQRILDKPRLVVGLDLDEASLLKHQTIRHRLVADSAGLPFHDACFDLVTANMVVEHLPDPAGVLGEVHRVLRPQGHFIFHTPNYLAPATFVASLIPKKPKLKLINYLENRHEDDVFPTTYRLNTPGKIERSAAGAGFDVQESQLINSSPSTYNLGPLVVFELLFIRLTRFWPLSKLKSNLVYVLRKKNDSLPRVEVPATPPDQLEAGAQRSPAASAR